MSTTVNELIERIDEQQRSLDESHRSVMRVLAEFGAPAPLLARMVTQHGVARECIQEIRRRVVSMLSG